MLLVGVALVAGCSTSSVVNQNGTSDSGVTKKMGRVHLGMTPAQARAILGKPNQSQTSATEGGYRSLYLYYGSDNSWQLAFDNGLVDHHPLRLTAKSRY